MIACPGLDFCSLANAGTLNVAKQIQQRFDDLDYLYDLGDIEIKMSGCMNACGHHHVGHIGILGVDKHGKEWYQITIGGSSTAPAALGEVIGPSVPKEQVSNTIAQLLEVYVRERRGAIVEAVRRLSDAGVGVDDLSLRRPTLDDVFLALTGHAAEVAREQQQRERAA